MSFTMSEGAVNRVKDYLSAELPEAVIEANRQWDTQPHLAQPTTYAIAEWATMPQPPCLLILTNQASVENESANYRMNTRHEITVIVVDRDQNQEQLRLRMYRWVQTIIKILQTTTARVAVGMVGWGDPVARYSPIYVAPNQPYEADAQIYFNVLMQEAF